MSAESTWGTVAARERGLLPEQTELAECRRELEGERAVMRDGKGCTMETWRLAEREALRVLAAADKREGRAMSEQQAPEARAVPTLEEVASAAEAMRESGWSGVAAMLEALSAERVRLAARVQELETAYAAGYEAGKRAAEQG